MKFEWGHPVNFALNFFGHPKIRFYDRITGEKKNSFELCRKHLTKSGIPGAIFF